MENAMCGLRDSSLQTTWNVREILMHAAQPYLWRDPTQWRAETGVQNLTAYFLFPLEGKDLYTTFGKAARMWSNYNNETTPPHRCSLLKAVSVYHHVRVCLAESLLLSSHTPLPVYVGVTFILITP